MNLEKFNEQQKNLNNLFAIHIIDLENTIARLISQTGPVVREEPKEDLTPYAILDKLEQDQIITAELIDRLCFLKQELYKCVYNPEEINQPKEGTFHQQVGY
jgi:hypothetical protein